MVMAEKGVALLEKPTFPCTLRTQKGIRGRDGRVGSLIFLNDNRNGVNGCQSVACFVI